MCNELTKAVGIGRVDLIAFVLDDNLLVEEGDTATKTSLQRNLVSDHMNFMPYYDIQWPKQ